MKCWSDTRILLLWLAIETLQADAAEARTMISRHRLGNLGRRRQRRATLQRQRRLCTLCQEYRDGKRTIADFLYAIGAQIVLQH